ncbi:MAG: SagB/ThcOx family dehydrogenase [Planctomycetes bacterium]|nr:SagB/ThcOx family dehydrogenase [Planctomycetota bacterium]
MEPWQCAIAYHDRTKHHFHGYARSLGYLDWATQPNPFRRFDGAPCIPLPRTDEDSSPPYSDIYALDRVAPKPVCSETISEFFYLSLAISAWKEFAGSRWALRCNPSSGNLHPTESYLVIGRVEGLSDAPGVYHYAPKQHALEMRTRFGLELWERLVRDFPPRTFFVGLSSIHWREAWKYGERAYRYCQQDMGHALAACSISGATLGWRVHLINQMSDIDIAKLLGLDRRDEVHEREREDPEAVLAVIPSPNDVPMDATLSAEVTDQIAAGQWHGRPNRLSSSHVQWERIDAVAQACMKPTTAPNAFGSNPVLPEMQAAMPSTAASARQIIRHRRSAVALDGRTAIPKDQFYAILSRVLPDCHTTPWNTLGPPVSVHLGLFVHRVTGLDPGLYCLVRSPEHEESLRDAMKPGFVWQRPPGCPAALPLYLLATGDCTALAARVSCLQDIAGDGAFSLGMIAEFEAPLRRYGAWFYRRLFWEAGAIGQVLYLEAEAAGIRSTGIGCYFDDPVHDVFGLRGPRYQSMYHFTMGGPVEDARLTTLPAYGVDRAPRGMDTPSS